MTRNAGGFTAPRVVYHESLEAFSVPLMCLVEHEESEAGAVTARRRARVRFRFREARRAIESIVELPDRLANLFIKVCLQNEGRLSAAKRAAYFSKLTDAEVRAMEKAVKTHLRSAAQARTRPVPSTHRSLHA